MQPRSFLVLLLFFLKFHNYEGCGPSKKIMPTPEEYDLNDPVTIKLNSQMNEISGLSFYQKDTSVFAIVDEDGLLFKIYLNRKGFAEKWRFDKKHDFEDVVLHDSTLYVLISNGEIETLKFGNSNIPAVSKSKFPNADKNTNEFETLYYDDQYKQLVMICKKCADDKKSAVTALGYDPDSGTYNPSLFTIDVKAIDEKLGEQKIHFKPSAAAINPVTNDLYILASVNKLLLIADRKGNMKKVYELDPATFNQPEGITFTPKGDMIISNEKGDANEATILIFKNKKRS